MGLSDKPRPDAPDDLKHAEEAALDIMKKAAQFSGNPAAEAAVQGMEMRLHPESFMGNAPSTEGLGIGVAGKAEVSIAKSLPLPGVGMLEAGSAKATFGQGIDLGLDLGIKLGQGGGSDTSQPDTSGQLQGLSSKPDSTDHDARLSDAAVAKDRGENHTPMNERALADKFNADATPAYARLEPNSLDPPITNTARG
ncbi:hypothetical protein [Streptomyces nigrescens]|uniref:hypothetical protein n=1 Tax=Streptomyces nigrescens TaxID=1920 RepID=UPI0034917DAC